MKMESVDEKPLLEVKDIKKYYPIKKNLFSINKKYVKAVDGLNFTVMKGETFGIVGESGCGKSTIGQIITQHLDPTEGEIWFEGENISKFSDKKIRENRKNLQFIFQDPFSSLNPRKKVFDIVSEPLIVHNLAKGNELRKQVLDLFETVGISEHQVDRYPHEFSGGQRQRIGIARALALKPKLIVCDEPVSALDVSIQAQILNLLKDLQKKFQLTYIFIAHGLPSVYHISDRIAVMYFGKIVEIASRDDLFSKMKHPYTEALLSAIPISNPRLRKKRVLLSEEMPNPANPPTGCAFHTRCPYVQPLCKEITPSLIMQDSNHFVACHYPLEMKD
ncbi:ABC transporter ATP-binding protein [Sporosarcina sp. FA9]|uniref:ABC transporter ATP-binding protein n=1 Tax=Sporosarcina sp. FA9 TaxID=3413030 RepID=UPI003F659276